MSDCAKVGETTGGKPLTEREWDVVQVRIAVQKAVFFDDLADAESAT